MRIIAIAGRDKGCESLVGLKWLVGQMAPLPSRSSHEFHIHSPSFQRVGYFDKLSKIVAKGFFPPISWLSPEMSCKTPRLA